MALSEEQNKDETLFDRLSLTAKVRINRLCDDFEEMLQKDPRAGLTVFAQVLSAAELESAIRELVEIELAFRIRNNIAIDVQKYVDRFSMLERDWIVDRINLLSSRNADAQIRQADPFASGNLGDYTILGPLGVGGMGQVYRAEHRLMGRQVAIKFLKDRLLSDPLSRVRFEREVRTISKLSHPNIVSAFDAREEAGMLFLITELIDGEDLSNLVRRKGPLKPRDAMYYVWQAAKGLKYAHEQGIIHRDVKPSNLLLEKKKTIKVLDLGLARLVESDNQTQSNGQAITNTTHIVGTAAFMSPEQAKTPHAVDERSDVYSLGCTLYYLIAGKPPFSAQSDVEIILAHLNDPAPELSASKSSPQISSELQLLVKKMLSKSPANRPVSMGEVVDKLASLLKAEQSDPTSLFRAIENKPDRLRRRQRAMAERGKWLWMAAVATVVVALPASFVWMLQPRGNGMPVVQEPDRGADRVQDLKLVPAPAQVPNPVVAMPSWNAGLQFDGVESFVRVPLRHEQVGESFAMEVAVVPNPHATPANLLTFSGPRCMAVFLANNAWGVAHYDGKQSRLIASVGYVQYGRPIIVGAQWRNDALSLTLDGEPVAVHEITYPMQAGPNGLFIGGIPPGVIPKEQGTRFFDGKIMAVRIQSGRLRPPARRIEEMSLVDDSTIAMFLLSERTGKYCHDISSHQLRGELVQADWFKLPSPH